MWNNIPNNARKAARFNCDVSSNDRADLRYLELENVRQLNELPKQLSELSVERSPQLTTLDGLERCAELQTLSLKDCPKLKDLRHLEHLPSLEELYLVGCSSLRSLEGVQKSSALKKVLLSNCAKLVDLSHIPTSSVLEELLFFELPKLESLRGLPALPRITSLYFRDCPKLEQLQGIEALQSLEEVSLVGTSVADVAPLAKLPKLRQLDLRGCAQLKNIDALEDAPDLRVVALLDAGVDRKKLPQQVRAMATFAKKPNLYTLSKRARPSASKTKTTKKDRSQLASIRQLLKSKALDQVDQALEQLETVGRADFYEALLKNAAVTGRGHSLYCSAYEGPLLHYTLMGLVAGAPVGCAPADSLAKRLNGLFLQGTLGRTRGVQKTPLAPSNFSRFKALKRISLTRVGPLIKRGAPPELPSLEYLSINGCGDMDLWWVQNVPVLKTLSLGSADLDLAPVLPIKTIEQLWLNSYQPLENQEVLMKLPKLSGLQLACPPVPKKVLENLPGLKTLTLVGEACQMDTSALQARGVQVERLTHW